MSVPQIRSILEKIFESAHVPSVSFTGGEPTLHPGLPELIGYAVELGFRVNLITNGTRITPKVAESLARAGLSSAQVSLEGVTQTTHERVTRVPGSFAQTLAGVRSLRQTGIRVHTNTTIHRSNLGECRHLPAFVKSQLDLERLSMNLVIPSGSAASNPSLIVPYQEIGEHVQGISAAAQSADVEFMWYSPTPLCLFNPIAHGLGNKGCSACEGLLSVGVNGDVLPCSSCQDPVGNLLVQDFDTIWNSAQAKRYRNKQLALESCHDCEDFPICHGACPLYWQHMGYEELPNREDRR
jgi:radical SAM protein with 4Fe4S-binding SPASM domain